MPAEGGWDVHTHLVPPSLLDVGRSGGLGLGLAGGTLAVGGGPGVPVANLAEPPALSDWVSGNGLDGALVSPPPPLFRPELAGTGCTDWARLVNDAMAEACASDARLRPLALLPAQSPREAAALAAGLDDGWAGVCVGTRLGDREYSESAYDALWEVLSDRRLPAFVHPGHCPDPRLGPFYLANLLGNPYETTVAAAHLALGGALERFPALTVVLAHGGGAVAALVGRWQRGHETARPGMRREGLSPLEAVRRFYVDALVHDDGALALVADVVGSERMLAGSDWPFPMGADSIDALLGGLPSEAARQVRVDNPARCFGNRLAQVNSRPPLT